MHSHNAAPISLQDLRSAQALGGTRAAQSGVMRFFARAARAWMNGWTWYVRQGMAPAAVEPAFPFRPGVRIRARRMIAPALARWVLPAAPLPVAALYDCATGAGCA